MNTWDRAQPYLIGALFIAAGVNHFRMPRVYESIVPAYVPYPAQMVAVSGVAEIAGGIGAVLPAAQAPAGYGLIALLLAVFPANIEMALHADRFPAIPAWTLWLRLPLQFLAILWVYRTLIRRPG